MPISDEGHTRIELRATDVARNVRTLIYDVYIDTADPVITDTGIEKENVDGWVTLASGEEVYAYIEVFDALSDIGSVVWGTDGVTYPNTASNDGSSRYKAGPFSAETITTLYYKVIDGGGNFETVIYQVKIDTTPPSITFVPPDPGWISAADVIVTFTGIDRNSLNSEDGSLFRTGSWEISSNNVDWSPISAQGNQCLYQFNEQGDHTYFVRITDKVGLTSAPVPVQVMLDGNAPVVDAADTGWLEGSSAVVDVTVTDVSGIDTTDTGNILFSFDNSTFSPVTSITGENGILAITVPIDAMDDGIHPLYLNITDRAGNENAPVGGNSGDCLVNIDRNPPEITRVSSVDWDSLSTLDLNLSDGTGSGVVGASFEFSFDNNTFTSTGLSWIDGASPRVPLSVDGEYSLYTRVSDSAGNTTSAVFTVRRDTEPPSVAAVSTEWQSGAFHWVDVTISDPVPGSGALLSTSGIQYRIDGGDWLDIIAIEINPSTRVQIYLEQLTGFREHPTEFRVSDTALNMSAPSTASLVRVDNALPVIDTAHVNNIWIKTGDLEISLEGTGGEIAPSSFLYGFSSAAIENGDAVVEKIDGSWKAVISGLADGERIMHFLVSDDAGNEATQSALIKKDTTIPVVDLLNTGIITGTTVPFSVTDTGSGLEEGSVLFGFSSDNITLTGAAIDDNHNGTWDIEVPVSGDGERTIYISFSDKAGNPNKADFPLVLDSGGPDLTLTAATGWTTPPVAVTAGAVDAIGEVDGSSWYFQLTGENSDYNDEAWSSIAPVQGDGATAIYEVTTNGIWRVWFKVNDNAGNPGIDSVLVFVDNEPPRMSITGGIADWTAVESTLVRATATDLYSDIDSNTWEFRIGASGNWTTGDSVTISAEGETRVFFRVKDMAGNSETEEIPVKLDRSGPVIENLIMENSYVTNQLILDAMTASDLYSGMDNGSWQYRIGGVGGWSSFSGSVDVSAVAGGPCILNVQVSDVLGNITESSVDFIIDRENPGFSSLALISGGVELEADSYINQNQVRILLSAFDNRLEMERNLQVSYILSPEYSETPDFSSAESNLLTDFVITGLNEGINYLYIRLTDYAGNTSDPQTRIIRVDSSSPGAPGVVSITHPEADSEYDAVAVKDAIFLFNPAAGNISGINYYSYSLQKGTEEYLAGTVNDGKVEFAGLPDNEPGEFYTLSVKVSGGNGQLSPGSLYTFRIDTNPPANLKVSSSTHANPDVYYNSAVAGFKWNRPLDFTGVKNFYYKWSHQQIIGPGTPADFTPDGTWSETGKTVASLDLEELTGNAAGMIYFAVCAEDYAQNRQYSQTYLLYDTEKPSGGDVTLVTDYTGRKVYLSWGGFTDNTGLDRVEISFAREIDSVVTPIPGTFVYNGGPGNDNFEGLETEVLYFLYFKVYDPAGNSVVLMKKITLAGEVAEDDTPVPFTANLKGFTVKGFYSSNPVKCEAEILFSEAMGLNLIDETTGEKTPIITLALENLLFDETSHDFLSGAFSGSAPFEIAPGGYHITGQGFSISTDQGLVFDQLSYLTIVDTPAGGDPVEREFIYDQVKISAPPQLLFSPVTTVESGGWEYQSTSGWRFSGVTTTGFLQDTWQLEDGAIDLTGINGYILTGDIPDYLIGVDETVVSPVGKVTGGNILPEFYLETPSNLFLVHEALVRGDKIVILRATVIFEEGLVPETVELENFSIDVSGGLLPEPGFNSSEFTINQNGYIYTVTSLAFDGNNLIIDEGNVNTGVYTFDITGADIQSQGVTYDLEITIPYFEVWLHGFRVSSETGRYTDAGILLETAEIWLPDTFGGGSRWIYGLLLSKDDSSVLQTGTSTESYPVQTEYGADVTINGLTLSNTGLYATLAGTLLPLFTGGEAVNFAMLPMLSTGTFGSGAAENEEIPLTIGGFSFLGFGGVFDGNMISFGTTNAYMGEDFYPENLEFTGFSFDYEQVAGNGVIDIPTGYYRDGWEFTLEVLTLDETGITASAFLELPIAFGSQQVNFPTFRLLPDGGYETGAATEDVYFVLHGWKMRGEGISLEAENLIIPTGSVLLHPVMGSGELPVPNIVIHSSGTLISAGTGETTSVDFNSANGFDVTADGYTFDADGLLISGEIYFPSALGEGRSVLASDIRLDHGGSVLLTEAPGPAIYRIAGWDVTAEGITFDREGLLIKQNTLKLFNSVDIDIPDIRYYADGEMKIEGQGFEGFSHTLGGVTLSITDISLDSDGLNVKSYITLPPFFDGAAIYFDKLTIHPDGTITSDTAVPELGFELGEFEFYFEDIYFDSDRFIISLAEITLPPAADSKTIRFEDFQILNDGSFILGGASVAPFKMWGYIFHIDNIGFQDGIVDFTGGITFPEDFVVEGLQGARLDIINFKISLDGTVQDFQVAISDPLNFTLYETWEIEINEISVTPQLFKITRGTLFFPPEMDIDSVVITGFTIDLETGDFDFGEITINGITKEFNGCLFNLDTITLSRSRGVEFTGSVVLGGEIPADFAGLTLTVDMFQVRPDFTIGDISAELSGINKSIFDMCTLTDGSLGFIKTDSEFILDIGGSIEFGTAFPGGIAGKSVTIHDFQIDITSGDILALSASVGNLSYSLLGISDVTGSNISFTLDPGTGLVDISVNGTMVLAGTFPDFLAGEEIVIADFTIDTAGTIKSFSATLNITEQKVIFNGIKSGGISVGVTIDGEDILYDVSGTILLDQSYGEGLGGASFTISSLKLNGNGDLIDLDIEGDFPQAPLFGAFNVENGHVAFAMDGPSNIMTSVTGAIRFMDIFPEGLRGKALTIHEFSVDSTGDILAFSASANPLELDLFGITRVAADTLTLELDSATGDILGDITGRIYLSTLFPEDMRQDPVTINTFNFSTAGAITALDATLDLPGDRDIFGGLILRDGHMQAVLTNEAVVFDVSGSIILPTSFPEGIGGTEIAIDELTFDSNGNILACNINTTLNNLMLFNTIKIVSGNFTFLKNGDTDLILEISGLLEFSDIFPEGIRGKFLTLSEFTISSSGMITAFAATTDPLTIDLFGVTRMTGTVITMGLNDTTGEVDIAVGGNLYLGTAFPASLQQDPITVSEFSINTAGTILAFDAAISPDGDRTIFDALILRDSEIRGMLNGNALVFGLTGDIILADSFPEGIAGTTISIADFRFNQDGNILALDLSVDIVDRELFGVLPLENASIDFSKETDGSVTADLSCDILLPDFFPDGLAGERVTVNTFKISSSGEIIALDAGITDLKTELFGVVDFQDASLLVKTSQSYGVVIDIAGTIILPESLPDGLGGLPLTIEKFTLSPTDGIIEFKAGISRQIEFDLFAGIKGRFNQATLGTNGFGIKGDILFPSTFPAGLANRVIELREFEMDWDANITAIEANLSGASIELAGFTGAIENLSLSGDGVNIEYITLTLPSALGGDTIGIEDAGFDFDGNFYGEFVVGYLDYDIAGFTLILNKPYLDFETPMMSFESVVMKMPDAIGGGEFTISGVSISREGFEIDGGTFSMPDFTVAGGLWFKDIFVELILDGSNYSIEGGGSVFVPGMGELSAMIGFTNINDTYPWGLKYARFDFIADGLGIPVANTGIFVNGIKGAIAFGPPGREMPDELRHLFGADGTRIMLGLYMRDLSGAIRGGSEVWLNVDTWDWAIKGDITLLYGFIDAGIIASVTRQYGFYAALYVRVAFIRGSAYIHIWSEDGRSWLCGAVQAELGIPEGLVLGIWPGEDEEIWIGGVGVEFGDFADGATGYKAYLELPIIGQIGAFVDLEGNFSLGSVAEFVLKDGGIQGPAARSTPAYTRNARGSVSFRDVNKPSEIRKKYSLSVPGRSRKVVKPDPVQSSRFADGSKADKGLDLSLSSRATGGPIDENVLEEQVEKIFFVVRYTEGDPLVSAVAPSGTVYRITDTGVEVLRTNKGIIMSIMDPEPGEWELFVENLSYGQEYEIAAYGKNTLPVLDIHSPAVERDLASDGYVINGRVNSYTGNAPDVTIFLAKDRYSFAGEKAGTAVVNSEGYFEFVLDTSHLIEGEYFIFAQVNDGNFTGKKQYAEGSLSVQTGSAILESPQELVVTVNDATTFEVGFINPNGPRSAGFKLYLTETVSGDEKIINLGYLTNTTVSGLEPGIQYEICVTAYNPGGDESDFSDTIAIYLTPQNSVINEFDITPPGAAIRMEAGQNYTGSIPFTTIGTTETGVAYDYMDYELIEVPEWLCVYFNNDYWDLTSGSGEVEFTLGPVALPSPGTYNVIFYLRNMGNRQLSREVNLEVTVYYPDPVITEVEPGTWNNLDTIELSVKGDNFLAGTQLFLDETELAITQISKDRIVTEIEAGLEAGSKTLKVTGPSGLETVTQVLVVEPDYTVVGVKTLAEIPAGGSGTLVFTIRGMNRFEGAAHFDTGSLPEGWTVSMNTRDISSGQYLTALVQVPGDEVVGSYVIDFISGNGDVLPCRVDAAESGTTIAPVISSLSSDYGYRGEELIIFGYGFGTEGDVSLGGTTLTAESYTDDRIRVTIPPEAESGDLMVAAGGSSSNALFFVVKNLGFNLYSQDTTLSAQPGDTLDITVQAAGYADWIDFTTSSQALPVVLDKPGLKPNGFVQLTVDIHEDTAFDNYNITLEGLAGNYTETLTFTIIVGEHFVITTETLPGGMAEVYYSQDIRTTNGTAPVTFTLADETVLPVGLNLSPGGILSGRPKQSGTFTFAIEGTDVNGRTAKKEFRIIIEENAWSHPNKDGGNSNYNPVAAPATGNRKWESEPLSGISKEILSGGGRIFVLTDLGVTGIHKDNGSSLYFYSGNFIRWTYGGGKLFLLGDDGIFHAIDARYGNLLWQRSGVTNFITANSDLYLEEGEEVMVIDRDNGVLTAQYSASLNPGDINFRKEGILHVTLNMMLKTFSEGTWPIVFEDTGKIKAVSADEGGIFLLNEWGQLTSLDNDYEPVGTVDTEITCQGQILLGPERIYVSGSYETKAYDRVSLTELFSIDVERNSAVLAQEKLYIGYDYRLSAVNGYNGEIIWSRDGNYIDLALSGEILYALKSAGEVEAFNGSSNAAYPETTITIDPALPNGERGYYTVIPEVTLTATDTESYVETIEYRIGSNQWEIYSAPFQVPEGEYGFTAAGTDNHGYEEPGVILNLLVDATAPVTTVEITGTPGDNGYYTTGVSVAFTAADNLAGVEYIYAGVNGETPHIVSVPRMFTGQGEYTIEYFAKDRAGNYEEVRTLNFGIDLEDPVGDSYTYNEPGAGVVYLTAMDTQSGIASIEYTRDGDPAVHTYGTPIVFTDTGAHSVTYRAMDRSGRTGLWLTENVETPEMLDENWIEDISYASWNPDRELVRNINTGDRIYAPGYGWDNYLKSLPGYLIGADYLKQYIQDNINDETVFISFKARVDIEVYILKHENSPANFPGWILIEENYPVEPDFFFTGGADVYKKSYKMGDLVEIPGSNTTSGWANLIFVQFARSNFLKILEPIPGTILRPGETVSYSAIVDGIDYENLDFEYTINGVTTDPEYTLAGDIDIPFQEGTGTLTLKLKAIDSEGTMITEKILMYRIINEFTTGLVSPGPGTEITVTGGRITIAGSPGMPVIKLIIPRLEPEPMALGDPPREPESTTIAATNEGRAC